MILKVRSSDGLVVGAFPDELALDGENMDGFTARAVGDGESYDPARRYIVSGGELLIDLAVLRAARWEEIKAQRAARLSVAPTPFGILDSDDVGRSNINGQITAILALGENAPAQIVWKMHDNSFATFSAAEFVQAGLLVSQHIASVYAASWEIETAINAARSAAEIEAITWPDD